MNNFEHPQAQVRMQAALAAGTSAQIEVLPLLIQRSGVDEDFFVRDTLTWALTRMPVHEVIPLLVRELDADRAQRPFAASQALHTLSKLKVATTWNELKIRSELLHRSDTAQTAWRTFAGLVPDADMEWLGEQLIQELGQGEADIQRSLSRALAELEWRGASISKLLSGMAGKAAQAHAVATLKLFTDPDSDFLADLEAARRVDNMGPC
ncbi:HEAT repeat domain-containing protein [Corynebacterium crudilactis]|uniref:HEAT repeat domain-containing protein n=1 Tax=Corynebacterium crudilactis TaxID=1652495 RepID=A0A172QUL9_9CORY|nr:HEAT repeat domain-containing protein [Corynebacterium crudilactis]ANE04393.1 hypothetical protein ccrud_09400 [Corynebacterium crudilactis]